MISIIFDQEITQLIKLCQIIYQAQSDKCILLNKDQEKRWIEDNILD